MNRILESCSGCREIARFSDASEATLFGTLDTLEKKP